jgi:hypothetical protein
MMQGNASLQLSPEAGPLHVLIVQPLAGFSRFEARLREVVRHYGERVRMTKLNPGGLYRFTRENVFLSKTVPNVLFIRGGEVIAQTYGDFSVRELRALVHRSVGSGEHEALEK